MTLPEAVIENRFLAADLVFIFGIFISFIRVNARLGNAMSAGRTGTEASPYTGARECARGQDAGVPPVTVSSAAGMSAALKGSGSIQAPANISTIPPRSARIAARGLTGTDHVDGRERDR